MVNLIFYYKKLNLFFIFTSVNQVFLQQMSLETSNRFESNVKSEFLFLQNKVSELITLFILSIEEKITKTLQLCLVDNIALFNKCSHKINRLITETTNYLFNTLYFDVQNKLYNDNFIVNNNIVDIILTISRIAEFGADRVIDRLYKVTKTIHSKINRNNLLFENAIDFDKSILKEINTNLGKYDILHIFSANQDDNQDFKKINYNEKIYL